MSNDAALLLGRILLVAIFPISAAIKLIQWPAIVGTLEAQGLPLATVGGYLAIAVELGGAAAIMLGVLVRPAALALALYCAATALIAHRFWEFSGGAFYGQMFSFLKNLAMIGGLGILAAIGPGRFAVRRSGA